MKGTPAGILFVFVLAGCETSHTGTQLTAGQAGALAVRLANDKADALFHHRPCMDNQRPTFESGHWVWSESCGFGLLDYQARVELAADGSTNNVDLKVLDNSLQPDSMGRGVGGAVP
jgi:hypothetical protein